MLTYGTHIQYSGLPAESIGSGQGSSGGGNWGTWFNIISSVVEVAAAIAIPFTGGTSALIGVGFASARAGVTVATGGELGIGTILDFAIPTGTWVLGSVARAGRTSDAVADAISQIDDVASAIANQSLKNNIAILESSGGRSLFTAGDDLFSIDPASIANRFVSQAGGDFAKAQELARASFAADPFISAASIQSNQQVLRHLQSLDLIKQSNDLGQMADILLQVSKDSSTTFDTAVRMVSEVQQKARELSLSLDFFGIKTNLATLANFQGFTEIAMTRGLIEVVGHTSKNTLDVSRTIRDEVIDALNITLKEKAALRQLILNAATESLKDSILLGYIKTLDIANQRAALGILEVALNTQNKVVKTTGNIMVDFSNSLDEFYKVTSRTKPSALQKILRIDRNESESMIAATAGYSKNLSNIDVLKSRGFYDKVARRVQWLKPQDAARDVTTPIYRKLRSLIKKSKSLKRLTKITKKVDDIRDIFAASGGVVLDSEWIVGYKLLDEKTTTVNKITILIQFDPARTKRKDPVFVVTTNKELAEFVASDSPGEFYLDRWALARNGVPYSNQGLNKIFNKSMNVGFAFGLLPIQLMRTLTSIISTFSKTGQNIFVDGFIATTDSWVNGFGKKIVTNIITRGSRITGLVVGQRAGSQILRRETQRFSNIFIGQGLKNLVGGKQFFSAATFGATIATGVFTGTGSALRGILGRSAGRGAASQSYVLKRIAIGRNLNIAGGLVRSPFGSAWKVPSMFSVRF